LYLFFDLPEEGAGEAVASSADSPPDNDNEFTPRERRILLQKMFMQVHRYFYLPTYKILHLKRTVFRDGFGFW
jgi:hypothetical protein